MAMNRTELVDAYRCYIACINDRNWANLCRFVHDDVHHNGRRLGLDGYRAMLEADVANIPDLHFDIEILLSDPPRIACRLRFDVTPKEKFLGLSVHGKKVSFTENVFYEYRDDKIREVWSIIDKAAIEEQLLGFGTNMD